MQGRGLREGWVCTDLNNLIKEKYADNPKWSIAIQNSDNFFIPLMAALGEARAKDRLKPDIDNRKAKLVEILRSSSAGDDPLHFHRENDSDHLEFILESVRSNIGRRRRAIVYHAWRLFFREGVNDPKFPIDWHSGGIE